jgi:hypothetical protein
LQLSAAGKNGRPQIGEGGEQLVLVAGARSHLYRTGLRIGR